MRSWIPPCAFALALLVADDAGADHLVASWQDNAIHILDDDMIAVESFPVEIQYPNALATDGAFIYSGYTTDEIIVVYDFEGVEQYSFDVSPHVVQGLELVGDELAVGRLDQIDFYDPVSGDYLRTIEGPGEDNLEGLGFDGELLWVLDDTALHGIDPMDGAIVETLPNVWTDCYAFGVSASGEGQLTLVCSGGRWLVVSSDDGSVITMNYNGVDMYGSAFFVLAECGDGHVDRGEDCDDDVESARCDVDCTFVECGDGVVNALALEQCDDANVQSGDGCSQDCTLEAPDTTEGSGATDDAGVVDSTTAEPTTEDGSSTSAHGEIGDTSEPDETSSGDAAASGESGCGCTSVGPRSSRVLLLVMGCAALGRRRRAQALP